MSTDRRTEGATAPTAAREPADESFVGRWSRRKCEARAGEPAPAADATPAVEPERPVLTDADMPPIDSLDGSSDWSGFLSPGVSEELRRTALRKLFQLPEFNVRDGLNDYDEDFTTFEPLGDVVTSDMRHRMAREEAAREAGEPAEEQDEARGDGGAGEEPVGEVAGADAAAAGAEPAEVPDGRDPAAPPEDKA